MPEPTKIKPRCARSTISSQRKSPCTYRAKTAHLQEEFSVAQRPGGSWSVRELSGAEEEEYDEKDYHHVRPGKIKDTGDHWIHKHVSIPVGHFPYLSALAGAHSVRNRHYSWRYSWRGRAYRNRGVDRSHVLRKRPWGRAGPVSSQMPHEPFYPSRAIC